MKQIIFAFLLMNASFFSNAQPGTPDSSFGVNGIAITEKFEATINSILIQPDGKIVVGGVDYTANAYLVVRYNSDGSLDEGFGEGGRAINNFGESYYGRTIFAIALQPDGKILAAGQYNASGDDFKFAVMRFNKDGSIDTEFGQDGLTVTSLSAALVVLRDMALLPDGRIVVAGDIQNGNNDNRRSFVACYTTQGEEEKTFGSNGVVIATLPTPSDVTSILVTKNSKILIGGYYDIGNKSFLLSYNNDGTINTEFGNNGLAEMSFGDEVFNITISDMSLLSDNSVITSGYISVRGKYLSIIAGKYTPTGGTDSSFGTNGYAIASATDGEVRARGLAITSTGTIVTAGIYNGRNTSSFASAYFTPGGMVDSSYGTNGIVYTTLPENYYPSGYDVAVQDDEKVVLAGYSHYVNFPADDYFISLVRYNGTESKQSKYVKIKRWLHHHGFTWEDRPDNFKYYSVQSSTNGSAFNEIARIVNRGNAVQQFEDASPASGTSYYRVAAVSANNATSYSNIIAIENNTAQIKVFPNPAKNVLQVTGLPAAEKTKLSITDLNGTTRMATVANSNVFSWNIGQLPKGNYVLHIQYGNTSVSRKFLKE